MTSNKLIWKIAAASNTYRSFHLLDERRRHDLLEMLAKGNRVGDSWEPVKVNLYQGEDESEGFKPLGDFISFMVLAISMKALSILQPLIENTVELLPLEADIGAYFGLNVDWIDCLDISNSVVRRFKSTGEVMDVERYAFHWEQLKDIHMFRITDLRMSYLFVSDTFKRVVEANNLRGLIFYPIKQEN